MAQQESQTQVKFNMSLFTISRIHQAFMDFNFCFGSDDYLYALKQLELVYQEISPFYDDDTELQRSNDIKECNDAAMDYRDTIKNLQKVKSKNFNPKLKNSLRDLLCVLSINLRKDCNTAGIYMKHLDDPSRAILNG